MLPWKGPQGKRAYSTIALFLTHDSDTVQGAFENCPHSMLGCC